MTKVQRDVIDKRVVAEVCHEANRAMQRHLDDPVSEPWESLDEETKESAIDGVANARGGASPRQSHENWMKFKLAHGWEYGEEKSLEHKTHPLLVDYDDLPPEQQLKDKLFLAIVRALS